MLRSLQARILALFVGLLLAVLGITVITLQRATYNHTLERVREELVQGREVVRDKLLGRQRALWQSAQTLTKDDALRQAIFADPNDQESLFVALNNHRARMGADLALLIDLDGKILVDTLEPRRRGQPFAFRELLDRERPFDRQPVAVVLGDRAYQLVAAPYYVPVSAPQPTFWLLLGQVLDDAEARALGGLAGLEISFLDRPTRRVVSSSLPPPRRAALARLALPTASRPATVRLAGQDYLFAATPVTGVGGGGLDVMQMRSTEEAVLDFRALSGEVSWIALASLLLATLGAALIARGITRPVRALTEAAQRLGSGREAGDLPLADRGEIGGLAREFDRMQQAIRERESAIHHLAYHDDLTGLPNRNRFRIEIDDAIAAARAGHGRLAVAMIDLDRFKDINDTLGHHVGDRLLLQVAQRLQQASDERGCVVARLGGDEFAMLMPALGVRQAQDAMAEMRAVLAAALETEELRVELEASIGIALYPDHGADPDSLLRQAEVAMYLAKERRMGVAFYDASQDRHSVQRLTLMGELRRAIESDQLEVWYQPKMDLRTSTLVEVEALVRWNHSRRGWVSPGEFVPLAEQTGAIRQLTRWVLRRALADAAAWQREGVELGVAVNLSALDLHDRELPRRLDELLRATGLDPRRLVLEVTESSVMADPDTARDVLVQLVASGITVAIDDFGTGYSSLAQLRRLPVQELKVDRSFVMEMGRSPEVALIVRATVDMGHSLGLRVVAEGVENAAALESLRAMGCDLAQGYHLGAPCTAAELVRRVRAAEMPRVENAP